MDKITTNTSSSSHDGTSPSKSQVSSEGFIFASASDNKLTSLTKDSHEKIDHLPGNSMGPLSPIKRDNSASETSLNNSVDDYSDNGICNEGFEERGPKISSRTYSKMKTEEPLPLRDTVFDSDNKEIVCSSDIHPPLSKSQQGLANSYHQDSNLNSGGNHTVDSSRGASTDGSIVEPYTPSLTESRRGTYSDSGTIPIGIATAETSPIIEENSSSQDSRKTMAELKSEKEELNPDHGKWKSMQLGAHDLSRTFMMKHNSLPEDPTKRDKLKYAWSCPPHGKVGTVMTWIVFLLLFWLSMVAMTDKNALPGGTLFSLCVLIVTAQLGGMMVVKIKLPPLLGMLLVGILFRSVPVIDVIGNTIAQASVWSSGLRSTALVVILIRAGLGLDPVALKKLSFVVVRLAFIPCLTETTTVAVVSHFLLGFPWMWGFMLGFILAAVSPAVVVPCLLNLQDQGYGMDKGIPTLVIAAASIDDVIAISGFGVCLGIVFASGSDSSPLWQGLKGPVEVLVGIGFGIVVGIILWVLPYRKTPNATKWRFLLLFLAGMLAVFGSKAVHLDGAGALACLCVAFVAGIGYRNKPTGESGPQVKDYFNYMWMFFQPMLFGLIGTEIKVSDLEAATIGWGIVTLMAGLSLRIIVSFFAVMGGGLNVRERLFVALAWLPKATVQAAIGSTALDYARSAGDSVDPEVKKEMIIMGKMVLTIAVLVILITAPIGAAAIMLTAPKLLNRTPPKEEIQEPEDISPT